MSHAPRTLQPQGISMAQLNASAAQRNYNITPKIDYRTVVKVDGPLVILDNVKFPKYAEIVNVCLGDGSVRKGYKINITTLGRSLRFVERKQSSKFSRVQAASTTSTRIVSSQERS